MEIVILGGLSGRLDQTMHTLHVLCQMTQSEDRSIITPRVKSSEKKRQLEQDDFAILNRRQRTWVLSENSLVWVLGKVSELS
jgi:thiamine pyrophosphokinase